MATIGWFDQILKEVYGKALKELLEAEVRPPERIIGDFINRTDDDSFSYLDWWDERQGYKEDLDEEIERRRFGTKPTQLKKCTCGVDKVGQGKHSSWCDKYEEEK